MPAAESDPTQTKITKWAAILLIVVGVATTLILLKYYVLPYQTVTGTLLDGEINWQSGEALHALAWSVLLPFFGLLTYKVIQRFNKVESTPPITKN